MNQKVLITLNNGAKRIVYRDDLCHELADLLRLYLHADALPGTGGTLGTVEDACIHSHWSRYRKRAF